MIDWRPFFDMKPQQCPTCDAFSYDRHCKREGGGCQWQDAPERPPLFIGRALDVIQRPERVTDIGTVDPQDRAARIVSVTFWAEAAERDAVCVEYAKRIGAWVDAPQ